MSSANKVTFSSCGITNYYFYLIANETLTFTCTPNGAALQTNCPATIVYGMEVLDGSTWVTFTSHALYTTHKFLTMSDNTDLTTNFMQTYGFDTVAYPGIYEDLHVLRPASHNSYYRIRFTARNEHEDRWGTLATSNEQRLRIRGTNLRSQATYTREINSAYNTQTNPYNPINPNLVINYQAFTSDAVLN